jgi:hypothetical protein
MNIRTISANVRYSKALAQGEHKTIELGAEASLDPGEDWALAQQGLYALLTAQLRTLWGKNGALPEQPQNGPESHVEAPATAGPPSAAPLPTDRPAHWCERHNCAFRRYEKNGKTWWSHKVGDGWCRES